MAGQLRLREILKLLVLITVWKPLFFMPLTHIFALAWSVGQHRTAERSVVHDDNEARANECTAHVRSMSHEQTVHIVRAFVTSPT